MRLYVFFYLGALTSTLVSNSINAIAQEGYQIGVGDTIEVSIVGIPDLATKSVVDQGGSILSPLGGSIKVSDLSQADARSKAKEAIVNKLFRQRAPDGREVIIQILPEEVQLSVVVYRPIYVSGDVSNPGEQPFRPGMTVRQAASVAGGYQGASSRLSSPGDRPIVQGDYNAAVLERIQAVAQVVRLETELKGGNGSDIDVNLNSKEKNPVSMQLIDGERQQYLARTADAARERDNLKQSLSEADKRLAVLSEQQKVENEGYKADSEEFARIKDIAERGAATNLRVTDARRASLLSASRALQTTAQVAQLAKEREEIRGKLARFDGERKVIILKDLQAGRAQVAGLNVKISALKQRMSILGAGSLEDSEYAIIVHRRLGVASKLVNASMDFVLFPGDVIEIKMRKTSDSEPEITTR